MKELLKLSSIDRMPEALKYLGDPRYLRKLVAYDCSTGIYFRLVLDIQNRVCVQRLYNGNGVYYKLEPITPITPFTWAEGDMILENS